MTREELLNPQRGQVDMNTLNAQIKTGMLTMTQKKIFFRYLKLVAAVTKSTNTHGIQNCFLQLEAYIFFS